MSRTLSAPGLKPAIWNVSPGLVTPEWRWAWQGLEAMYPLWEAGGFEARDVAGHRDATVANPSGSFGWTATERGVAADFTDDFHDGLEATPVFDTSGWAGITMATLARIDSDDANFRRILSLQYSGGDDFRLWHRSGSINMGFDDGTPNQISGSITPALNALVPIVATHQGGTSRLYIDGVLVDSVSESVDIAGASGGFRIGATAESAPDDAENFLGQQAVALVASRGWEPAEALAWSRDPFGPFRMRRREAYLTAAGGGGGLSIPVATAHIRQQG